MAVESERDPNQTCNSGPKQTLHRLRDSMNGDVARCAHLDLLLRRDDLLLQLLFGFPGLGR